MGFALLFLAKLKIGFPSVILLKIDVNNFRAQIHVCTMCFTPLKSTLGHLFDPCYFPSAYVAQVSLCMCVASGMCCVCGCDWFVLLSLS